MSVIATALKHLMAAGVSGDDLVRAVAEMEAAVDTRSTGAKRQARYRENKRNKTSQSVTRVTSDASDAPPPNDIYSNPPGSPPVEAKASTAPKGKNRNNSGERLAADWQPKPLTGETAAMVSAWPSGMLERQLAQFRDHFAKTPGSKGKSLDWDASLRTWLRNADQWMGERNGRGSTDRGIGSGGRLGGHQSSGDGLSPTTRAAERVFGSYPGHPH